MSSPPPPPPPPPPAAVPPAWDRRAYRTQRRAAHLAARQQRTLQRLQLRSTRKRSVVGPVLLIGIGAVMLATEWAHVQAQVALLWLAHWWPLLLVGAGVVLLAEWALDTRSAAQQQGAAPRRSLGPLGVILLTLATLAGLAATGLQNSAAWMQRNWQGGLAESWGLDQLLAQHRESDKELTAAIAPGGLLSVQNYRGDIHISGSSPDAQVHISVHQRIEAWRQDELRARQRRDQPQLRANGSGLQLLVPGEGRDRADITIEVPHDSALQISAEHGELSVSELRGAVSIADHAGNVTLTGLTGDVRISTHDENATISGHSLSGNIAVDGRTGDLSFSDVTGPLSLAGDFFGTTHLERIHGATHFHSSFTDLTCASIPGELTVDGRSELNATDLVGPVVLATSDRNITLAGVQHGLTITNRNGSVDASLLSPIGPVTLNNANGSLQLHVPEAAAFTVNAEASHGEITNDLGLVSRKVADTAKLTGQVHTGGPALVLRADQGDIAIDHGTAITSRKKDRASSREDDEDD